ncbi:hypothetical protein RKD42_007228 [Streptomyces ambofaciens]
MGHVDPSHLVELALGHASGDADVGALRHVASCPRCRGELARLTRVVSASRGARVSDLPVAPPERVWQRIVHEVFKEGDGPPLPRERPTRRSVGGRGLGGARGALLTLAPAAVFVLVRWLRTRAGRGPARPSCEDRRASFLGRARGPGKA